jgi:hypothetical protein
MVAGDLRDEEIAARLHLSVNTIKNTLVEIRDKLGARSRVGVAVIVATQPIHVCNMSSQNQAGKVRGPYRKTEVRP